MNQKLLSPLRLLQGQINFSWIMSQAWSYSLKLGTIKPTHVFSCRPYALNFLITLWKQDTCIWFQRNKKHVRGDMSISRSAKQMNWNKSLWSCNFQINMTLHDVFWIKNNNGTKFLFVRPICFEFLLKSLGNILTSVIASSFKTVMFYSVFIIPYSIIFIHWYFKLGY